MRTKALWRTVLFRAGLLVGLSLLLVQVRNGYLGIARGQFYHLDPIDVLAAVGLTLVQQLIIIGTWIMIMRTLHASLTARQAMEGWLFAFLPRYVPGTVWGYWSRSRWLAETCQVGYSISMLGSVLEVGLLLMSALCVVGGYLALHSLVGWWTLLLAGAVVLFLVVLALPWLTLRIWRLLSNLSLRIPLLKRNFHLLEPPDRRLAWPAWLAAIGCQSAMWAIYGWAVLYTEQGSRGQWQPASAIWLSP